MLRYPTRRAVRRATRLPRGGSAADTTDPTILTDESGLLLTDPEGNLITEG